MPSFHCERSTGRYLAGHVYTWDRPPVDALGALRGGFLRAVDTPARPKRGRPRKAVPASEPAVFPVVRTFDEQMEERRGEQAGL